MGKIQLNNTKRSKADADFWDQFLERHCAYPRIIDDDGYVLVSFDREPYFVGVDDPNIP